MVKPKELKRKRTAKAILSLENKESMPLAALPKNCSPAPVIEPDKPALFPDCNKTVAIKPSELIIRTTIIKMVMYFTSLKGLKLLC
jgi:hypothetical protein